MKTILTGLIFIFSATYACAYDKTASFNCSVAAGRYNETQKFTIYHLKPNGRRDISFHTLGVSATNVCIDDLDDEIECNYDGYQILIDIGSKRDIYDSEYELKEYIVNGTIDTFWRSQAMIICRQKKK